MERRTRLPILEVLLGLSGLAMVVAVLAVQTRTNQETAAAVGMAQAPVDTTASPTIAGSQTTATGR